MGFVVICVFRGRCGGKSPHLCFVGVRCGGNSPHLCLVGVWAHITGIKATLSATRAFVGAWACYTSTLDHSRSVRVAARVTCRSTGGRESR